MRLTKAYDLLSDPDRRRNYDNHGVTEDTPNFNKKHDYSQYNRHGDPFDHLRDLFGDSFHSFRSGETQPITVKYLYLIIDQSQISIYSN